MVMKDLAGKQWTCTDIMERQIFGEKPPTIQFGQDGTVSGTGGCNTYTGTYSLNGDKLTFSPLAATEMMCTPGQMDQEYTYFTVLKRVVRVQADNEELKLFTEDNPVPMLFTTGESGLW